MLTILLIIFWIGVIAASINMARDKRERARAEAAEVARKKALAARLEARRAQNERAADELIARLKNEGA